MAKVRNSFDTGREGSLCSLFDLPCPWTHLSCLFVALLAFPPLLDITYVQMLTGAYRWQQPSETVAERMDFCLSHTFFGGAWGVVWIK